MTDTEILELIGRRRRQILVHSCIYYRFDYNLIDDYTYDMWSKELAELQVKYPNLSKEADLYEEFKDFDGSTGFDLPIHTPKVVKLAQELINYHMELKRGE